MKVLITGGTGLIGSHTIARMLNRGKQVVALVRDAAKLQRCLAPLKAPLSQLETVIGDVSDAESLTYEEYYALLCKVTGKSLQRQFIAGWLLRVMGSVNDLVSQLTRKPALLTREAAEVFTRSVPCDDTPLKIETLTLHAMQARVRDACSQLTDCRTQVSGSAH